MPPRKHPKGARVHIAKVDATKTVVSARWDGGDWVYKLVDDNGVKDKGWLEHELRQVT